MVSVGFKVNFDELYLATSIVVEIQKVHYKSNLYQNNAISPKYPSSKGTCKKVYHIFGLKMPKSKMCYKICETKKGAVGYLI